MSKKTGIFKHFKETFNQSTPKTENMKVKSSIFPIAWYLLTNNSSQKSMNSTLGSTSCRP